MKSLRLFIFSLLFATTLAFTQANPHIYILSEGGFSTGTSRLDRYETSSQTYHSNVFQNGSLGLYPDGLLVHGETLYITEQGGFGGTGTIYLADTLGVVQAAADAGINPYMLALHSDKLYITNGPAGLVTVLNAADLSPVTGIGVGVFPQEIVAHGDYVYVANNSLWGGDNDYTVSVIDPATDQVINSVYVGLNPSAIAPLPDGSVLVGVPWTDSGGKIYRIEPGSFAKTDSFATTDVGFDRDIFVDPDSDHIYFLDAQNGISVLDYATGEISKHFQPQGTIYAYGYFYDPLSNRHYIADAKDFAQAGEWRVYDDTGAFLFSHNTAIAPKRMAIYSSTITTSVRDNQTPLTFALGQNYPNPFNPSTTIPFTLEKSGKVTIEVFDATGRMVWRKGGILRNAGRQQMVFSGENLASGTYFYRLSTNGQSHIRKMLMVK
jgi:YVTN family beta-propeller protein